MRFRRLEIIIQSRRRLRIQRSINQAPTTAPKRLDMLQLQRDADDLARTAQTIPIDVASVRKGMLPKDVIDKLKQIEKLSKRLRTELNP